MAELMIYQAEVSPDLFSETEVNFIGLVEQPAINKNFMAFNNHKVKPVKTRMTAEQLVRKIQHLLKHTQVVG